MRGVRTSPSRSDKAARGREEQVPLKFGVDIQAQDLAFLHTIAQVKGYDFDQMLSAAIVLGCESLRKTLTNEVCGAVPH